MGKSQDKQNLPDYNADQPPLPSKPDGWFAKLAAKWRKLELRQARFEAEKTKRSEKRFARSRLGKWWIPIREQMMQTRGGRIKLRVITGLQIVALLAVIGLARPLISWTVQSVDDAISPPAYTLTAEEQEEGYGRTCSGRNCVEDDVYYRFYEENDYMDNTDCRDNYDWCVFAIPRETGCEQIYMIFKTSETDGLLAGDLETLNATAEPERGQWILPGQRVTLGVVSKDLNSEYGQVESIYCVTP